VELYLIRHTTPDIKAGICYGRSDIDVAATFPMEAEAVRQKFASLKPEIIYTSPSQRCAKLASMLAGYGPGNLPVEDARLMELHFGEWEMRGWQEISQEALKHWGASYIHEPPPGGETFLDLHQRARDFLVELRNSEAASVAVVTHAGVIRALLAETTNKPLNETFDFELSYGGVTKLELFPQNMNLTYVNR
jgi:alpha-ribazole phosphatase